MSNSAPDCWCNRLITTIMAERLGKLIYYSHMCCVFARFTCVAAGSVLWLLFFLDPVLASKPPNHFAEFARSCRVAADFPSARLLSNNRNNRWMEYASVKDIPQTDSDWSEWAYVWAKSGSPSVVDLEGEGEDFSDSTYYCFETSGTLAALRHEFRTAWGWGYVETKLFGDGRRETSSSYFFNMDNGERIPAPEDAGDFHQALAVTKLSEMPFFSLLSGEGHKKKSR